MTRVDYSKEHFCHQCSIKVPLNVFRCPDCHQKVRTKAHNKNQYYWKAKKYMNIEAEGRGNRPKDFKVKMRKLRIQRMMQGLNPNIPVPE